MGSLKEGKETVKNEVCKLRTGRDLEQLHDLFYVVKKCEEYPIRGYYRQVNDNDPEYIGHTKENVIELLNQYPSGSILWVPNRDRKRGGFVANFFEVGVRPWDRVIL